MRLFNTRPGTGITGDCFNIKMAFHAATIFDPLDGYNIAELGVLIGDLKYFGFPEFNSSFLETMKKEAPLVMIEMTKPFDLDAEPHAKQYNEMLAAKQDKAVRKSDAKAGDGGAAETETGGGGAETKIGDNDTDTTTSRDVDYMNWQGDPVERGRRVWIWWKTRLFAKIGSRKFPAWALALRLVALVRPSSAAVERVFSHLKRLVDICGHNMLAEVAEARMLTKCNKHAR